MIVRLLFLLLTLGLSLGSQEVSASIQFPDEPVGFSQLVNHPFDNKTNNGVCNDYYPTGGGATILSDGSWTVSPPNFMRNKKAAYASNGGTVVECVFTAQKQLFFGLEWASSNPFGGYNNGANKIGFMMSNRPVGGGALWGLHYYGATQGSRVIGVFLQASAGVNNCHVPNWVGDCGGTSVVFLPNINGAAVAEGTKHNIQITLKRSSTETSRDGTLRVVVDGALRTLHMNINTPAYDWISVQTNHTWDGQCANRPGGNPATPTVYPNDCRPFDDWHDFGHFYVSGSTAGGGTGGGGGGSTPPPPPPPPPGSPGTVGDLAATAVNTTRASIQFTAVNDGSGNPAKYDIRINRDVMSWGSAQLISAGTCTVPFAPGVMNQLVSCNIDGLTPGYTYKIQLVGFRGTMNLDAVYGNLSNVATVTMLAETPPPSPPPPTPPPTPPSPPPGISAPSNLTLLSADTYRIARGADIWELRGASPPFVLYKNGVCGACDVVGHSLIFSQELDTIGLEFQPGKHQYLDTALNEWVVISGTILGLTGASVTGSFSYSGTIPAGFNVYWSASPGGSKARLPLYTGVWDRGFHDNQHSFGCYEVRGYDGTGVEGPVSPEVCTASGPGSSRDIGQITPRKVIDFAGAVWELQGVSAPYVMYKDGVCECTLAGYSLRYKTGVVEMEYLPGKWVRRDATLNEWVITEP